MKKIYLILSIILFLIAVPVFAKVNKKDAEIYTAFQEMLDRDPTMEEYHGFVRNYKGMNFVKSSLNKTDERREAIKNIYQKALKRNPREDEIDGLVKLAAMNSLIRKQLYESKERELAIIDVYRNFLDRDPVLGDLKFYIKTRSPLDKIKEALNRCEERKNILIKKYKTKNGVEPNADKLAFMLDNQTQIKDVDFVEAVKPSQTSQEKAKKDFAQITVFSDFECIYCAKFHSTIKKIEQLFGGKVQITAKHFPLYFHKEAKKAAMAYECAKEQGKAEEMSNLIYQARIDDAMGVEKWKSLAVDLGLDAERFNSCLDSDKYSEKIEADASEAKSLNITAIPTTFIEDERVLGNRDFDYVVGIIKAKLGE
ncbi:MAG: thioredoxin domain-containing protein [bacterium]